MADTFVWYDLMTTDPKAAQGFYGDVVGWSFRPGGPPSLDYTVIQAGEAGVGGMMTLPQDLQASGIPPHWIGYISVADVDQGAERLKAADGRVMKAPADIPGVGRFTIVVDPHGAAFVLFWGNSTPPAKVAPGLWDTRRGESCSATTWRRRSTSIPACSAGPGAKACRPQWALINCSGPMANNTAA